MYQGLRIIALALLVIALPAVSIAQLSCDEPPAPFNDDALLNNWQNVWNLTDVCKSAEGVFYEIMSGGVGRDGIPPIDNPQFDDLATADLWLQASSPVIALEIDGIARAYPLAILTRHEIANDIIGDTPVAVTFCPLCNSAIVFDRRVGGDTLRLGVSGLLRNSDLIMWDDLTQSLWQQLTGEGIVGTYTGTLLDIVPSQVISFGSFAKRHPDGLVMSRDTGYNRQYGLNPYRDYDTQPGRPFLFRGEIDPRLDSPVDRVLAATIDDVAVAYPFDILRVERVINDVVADTPLAVFYQAGVASALGDSVIDNARDTGTAGMYEATLDDGSALRFAANSDGTFRDESTQSTWNAFGEAIAGELEGSQLRWINAFPHFWFAWAAFHPATVVYGI